MDFTFIFLYYKEDCNNVIKIGKKLGPPVIPRYKRRKKYIITIASSLQKEEVNDTLDQFLIYEGNSL